MARFLIVYGSEEGQTEKIARHMVELLDGNAHTVDLVYGKKAPRDLVLSDYDGVIVGASIHAGHHQKYMVDFAQRYKDPLNDSLSAFFTVCLTAKGESEAEKEQVAQYFEDFTDATGWYPDQMAAFAGALAYTRYGLIKRFLMKRISADSGGDTDTSRDYEYTDWASVDDFVDSFTHAVAGDAVMAQA